VPLVLVATLASAACAGRQKPAVVTQGNQELGRRLMSRYGCGSCHTIPGVEGATALVGPPLTRFGLRSYIAGRLGNNEANLAQWIRDPQGIEPGTAMPNLNVSPEDAQNMAAYLTSLR
jgi:cytochrome c1